MISKLRPYLLIGFVGLILVILGPYLGINEIISDRIGVPMFFIGVILIALAAASFDDIW